MNDYTFRIGSYTFPTKKAARQYASELLRGSEIGADVTAFGAALVTLHPDLSRKIAGREVTRVTVGRSGRFGSKGYQLNFTNGESEIFSYRACFTPPTERQNLMNVLRQEVQSQIDAVAKPGFEVDHHPVPFVDIAEDFIILSPGDLSYSRVGEGVWALDDRTVAADWFAWHHDRFRYRLLTPDQHREATRLQQRQK